MGVTKTDFMRGMQCRKMLWLDRHKPGLRVIPLEVQARLDAGTPCVVRLKVPETGETVVHDLVRGFDPAPGAFTFLPDGKLLKIWETRVTGTGTEALPGTVVSVTKKDFSVACRDEELRILTVQPESKKRMPAAVFLNGRGVQKGDIFCSK